MNGPSGFLFVDDIAAYRDPEALLARVPARTRGKRELLTLLATARFPGLLRLQLGRTRRLSAGLRVGARGKADCDRARRAAAEGRGSAPHLSGRAAAAVAAWPPGEAHELLAVFPTKFRAAIAGPQAQ